MTAGRRCHSIDFVDWLVGEFFSFKGKSHHVGQAAFELVVSASVSGVLELQICDPSGARPSGSTSTLLTLQKKGKFSTRNCRGAHGNVASTGTQIPENPFPVMLHCTQSLLT